MFDTSLATLDLDTLDFVGAGPGPGMPSHFTGSGNNPTVTKCVDRGLLGAAGGAIAGALGGPPGIGLGALGGAIVGCGSAFIP